MSAGSPVRSRARFASPDRFIPQRPLLIDRTESYHTSKPPVLLQGRERNDRRRDNTIDPFRSISASRSRSVTRQRNAHNAYNLRPPRYVPSFVYGRDATPAHVDARVATSTLRHVSDGFWTVGGRVSFQLGQLQGVPSGSGGLLASGTIAPLHTASFLDQPTKDDRVMAHERRLALALDIDLASRILLQSTTTEAEVVTPSPERNPFSWRNGAWTRGTGPSCKWLKHSRVHRLMCSSFAEEE